ncbi:MAG TPA: hypothetical protein VL400_05055, partial [Polyangiaceae bacterium]|nr:hypothetical protein [Polyangiaceae bacterium]
MPNDPKRLGRAAPRRIDREARRLAIVLHAHLPFIAACPPGQSSLEERWLFEALRDAYLPLVAMLARVHEGTDREPLLTLSVSPTLACMLREPALASRFGAFLDADDRAAKAAAEARPELAPALADHRAR